MYMNIFLFTLCLVACCQGSTVDRTDCYMLDGGYGQIITCPAGLLAVGSCGSGRDADCGGYHTRLECCREVITNDNNLKEKACQSQGSLDHGSDMYCLDNMVIKSICGSGSDLDCSSGVQDFYTAIQCCDDHSLSLTTTCFWQYAPVPGTQLSCPVDAVARGLCGSGASEDCNGGFDSHGLYCCTFAAL